jgi:drug/metabolite transporter (DMT)-like permease
LNDGAVRGTQIARDLQEESMSRKGWLLFAAMCLIWGIPYLLIRVAVRDVSPAFLVCTRTGLGGLLLVPFALARGGFRVLLPHWRPLLAFVVVELAVAWFLLSDAETKLSSSLSGLLVAAVPLVGVIIARLGGDESRIEPLRLVGLLMGFGGVAALVGLDLSDLNLRGVIELAIVVVCYAIGPVIQARWLSDLPSYSVVSAALLICGIGYLPAAIVQHPSHVEAGPVASIVVLGTVCTALAFVVFFALIAEVGPARAVVFTYVNPAVAVLLGVIFLSETFTVGMAVGFPLILAGSVLAARRKRPDQAPAAEVVPEAAV